MATGKKSFVLYADLIHTVSQLDNAKAGELFKHILNYVNDNDPESDDLIINIAFEPIKQQLKRDLDKWGDSLGKKSESGRIGNLKRWHPDLHHQYMMMDLTLKEAEKIAKHRKTSQREKSVANIADNVNVNETVNVNDNAIQKKEGNDFLIRNDDFLEFWKIYDKQIDEDDCARIWRGLRPQDREMILQIVPLYVKSQPEQQFRKNPKGFLLGKCWNDRDIIKNFKNKNNDWITEKLRSIV